MISARRRLAASCEPGRRSNVSLAFRLVGLQHWKPRLALIRANRLRLCDDMGLHGAPELIDVVNGRDIDLLGVKSDDLEMVVMQTMSAGRLRSIVGGVSEVVLREIAAGPWRRRRLRANYSVQARCCRSPSDETCRRAHRDLHKSMRSSGRRAARPTIRGAGKDFLRHVCTCSEWRRLLRRRNCEVQSDMASSSASGAGTVADIAPNSRSGPGSGG